MTLDATTIARFFRRDQCGHKKRSHFVQRPVRFELRRYFKAVGLRHDKIDDHEIGLESCGRFPTPAADRSLRTQSNFRCVRETAAHRPRTWSCHLRLEHATYCWLVRMWRSLVSPPTSSMRRGGAGWFADFLEQKSERRTNQADQHADAKTVDVAQERTLLLEDAVKKLRAIFLSLPNCRCCSRAQSGGAQVVVGS